MWVAGCVDRLCEKAGWLTTTPRRRCNDRPLLNNRDRAHGTPHGFQHGV